MTDPIWEIEQDYRQVNANSSVPNVKYQEELRIHSNLYEVCKEVYPTSKQEPNQNGETATVGSESRPHHSRNFLEPVLRQEKSTNHFVITGGGEVTRSDTSICGNISAMNSDVSKNQHSNNQGQVQQQVAMAQQDMNQQQQTITVMSSMPSSMGTTHNSVAAMSQVQQQVQQQVQHVTAMPQQYQSIQPNQQHQQQISADWGNRLQVIQHPQNNAYFQQVYNAQGQLLMAGNVGLNPGMNPQQYQVITTGNKFQGNQLTPQMIAAAQAKQVMQEQVGFSGYTTIPTTQNQTLVFSPMGVMSSQGTMMPAQSHVTTSSQQQQQQPRQDINKVMTENKVGNSTSTQSPVHGQVSQSLLGPQQQSSHAQIIGSIPGGTVMAGGQQMQIAPWQYGGALPQVWSQAGGIHPSQLIGGHNPVFIQSVTQPDGSTVQGMFVQYNPQQMQTAANTQTASQNAGFSLQGGIQAGSQPSVTQQTAKNVVPDSAPKGIRPLPSNIRPAIASTQTGFGQNQAAKQNKVRAKSTVVRSSPAPSQQQQIQIQQQQQISVQQQQMPIQQQQIPTQQQQQQLVTQQQQIPTQQQQLSTQQQHMTTQQQHMQLMQQQVQFQQIMAQNSYQQSQQVQKSAQQNQVHMVPATQSSPSVQMAQGMSNTNTQQMYTLTQTGAPLQMVSQQLQQAQQPMQPAVSQHSTVMVSSGHLLQANTGMAESQTVARPQTTISATPNTLYSVPVLQPGQNNSMLNSQQNQQSFLHTSQQQTTTAISKSQTPMAPSTPTKQQSRIPQNPSPAPFNINEPQDKAEINREGQQQILLKTSQQEPVVNLQQQVQQKDWQQNLWHQQQQLNISEIQPEQTQNMDNTQVSASESLATSTYTSLVTSASSSVTVTAGQSVSTSTTETAATYSESMLQPTQIVSDSSSISIPITSYGTTSSTQIFQEVSISSNACTTESFSNATSGQMPSASQTTATSSTPSISTPVSMTTVVITTFSTSAATISMHMSPVNTIPKCSAEVVTTATKSAGHSVKLPSLNPPCTPTAREIPNQTYPQGSAALTSSLNADKGLPKAMVKPNILTHVIKGYVIQEASEPFAISRPTRELNAVREPRPSTSGGEPPRKRMSHGSRDGNSTSSSQREAEDPNAVAPEPDVEGAAAPMESTPAPLPAQTAKVSPSPNQNPQRWTVNQVSDFIRNIPGCAEYADDFQNQEVDGEALLLIRPEHLVMAMSMKLGPAVKIVSHIDMIRPAKEPAPQRN